MNTEEAIKAIREDGHVFDIGQLEPQAAKDLNKLVGQGKLGKAKVLWPDVTRGTVRKTVYTAPGKIGQKYKDVEKQLEAKRGVAQRVVKMP